MRRQGCFGSGGLSKAFAGLIVILLSVVSLDGAGAAGYVDGLAPPGVPAGAFPAPSRKVAGIVTDTWRDEHSTNRGLGNSPREVDVTDEAPI
jgi:hypothetical protein